MIPSKSASITPICVRAWDQQTTCQHRIMHRECAGQRRKATSFNFSSPTVIFRIRSIKSSCVSHVIRQYRMSHCSSLC